jgi:hypothetical protein
VVKPQHYEGHARIRWLSLLLAPTVARHFGTGGFEPSAAHNVQWILRAGRECQKGKLLFLPFETQRTLAVEFEPSDGVSRQCLGE